MATEMVQDSGDTVAIRNAATPPAEVAKTYAPQGDLTLYRLVAATNFTCKLCNKQKKSKLVATANDQWDNLRCNGCYGQVLSTKWYTLSSSECLDTPEDLTRYRSHPFMLQSYAILPSCPMVD
jgi:hypothetical protein